MKCVSILVSLCVGLIVGSGVASAQKTDGPFIMGNIDSSCVTAGAAAGNWTITCGDIAPGSETTLIAPPSVDSVLPPVEGVLASDPASDPVPDPAPVDEPASDVSVVEGADTAADTDSDGDGISDEYEINVYATDPGVWDTDGDGLSDGDELLTTGSDPFLWDTDADGIADGDEGAAGTDPLDPESSSSDAEVTIRGTSSEDSDNDRLAETDEATVGTDPSSPDSDGDGYYDGDEVNLGTDPRDPANFPEASESPESL
jgi:Bacterial TSP3 repeat